MTSTWGGIGSSESRPNLPQPFEMMPRCPVCASAFKIFFVSSCRATNDHILSQRRGRKRPPSVYWCQEILIALGQHQQGASGAHLRLVDHQGAKTKVYWLVFACQKGYKLRGRLVVALGLPKRKESRDVNKVLWPVAGPWHECGAEAVAKGDSVKIIIVVRARQAQHFRPELPQEISLSPIMRRSSAVSSTTTTFHLPDL